MSPTLNHGQIVVCRKTNRVKPTDVILLLREGKDIIKRVGLVEGGKLYLLGDNPAASTDSRHFGTVSVDEVIGKVVWPISLVNPNNISSPGEK